MIVVPHTGDRPSESAFVTIPSCESMSSSHRLECSTDALRATAEQAAVTANTEQFVSVEDLERPTLRAIAVGVKLYRDGVVGVFAPDGRFLGETSNDREAQAVLDADRAAKGGAR